MDSKTAQPTASQGENKHKFERAGLGKAPFRFIGVTEKVFQAVPGDPGCPIQPGSSCDYCGNGIRYEYWVRSNDGRQFKVGCDCIWKAGDAGLVRTIKNSKAHRDLEAAKRAALNERKKAELQALLDNEVVRANLEALPADEHRRKHHASLLSQLEGSLPWCGAAGRNDWLKRVKSVAGQAVLS